VTISLKPFAEATAEPSVVRGIMPSNNDARKCNGARNSGAFAHGRILVIDDDESILAIISRFLSSEGHEVICAPGGVEAVDRFKSEKFDLVITDMYMPGMDGLDLIKKLKTINVNIPIIVLTAAGSISNVVQSLKLGAQNYMTKPFKVAEVSQVVQKALKTNQMFNFRKDFFDASLDHSRSVFILPSNLEHARQVTNFTDRLVGVFGFESTWMIQLALMEAITNAVVHGNGSDENKKVTVVVNFSKERLEISVEDEGDGFTTPDPASLKLESDIFAPSGRGLFLINSYMDELFFNDRGSKITMIKKR